MLVAVSAEDLNATSRKKGLTMTIELLRNTPLRPLATRMRELAKGCVQFDVATAFVSEAAVRDLLGHALDGGATVRFLTGTFGASTRKATFETLFRLGAKNPLVTRIWACQTHQNFHVKLYLWRFKSGRGVAWVGSSNFTDGGLQSEGELVVEFSGQWDGTELVRLRAGFEREWKRGTVLSEGFIAAYEESERKPPDFAVVKHTARGRSRAAAPSQTGAVFITSVDRHIAEGTPTYERVEALLGGVAENWLRHHRKSLSKLRPGQRGFVVDTVDREVALVEVTDRVRDGRASVFSYSRVFPRAGAVPWNAQTKKAFASVGVAFTAKGAWTSWLIPGEGRNLAKAVYPSATKNW